MTTSNMPTVLRQMGAAARTLNDDLKNVNRELTQTEQVNKLLRDVPKSFRGIGDAARTAGTESMRSMSRIESSLRSVRFTALEALRAVDALGKATRRVQPPGRAQGGSSSGSGWADTGAFALAAAGALSGGALVSGIRGAAALQGQTLQAGIAQGKLGSDLAATTRNMNSQFVLASEMSRMTGQSITDSMGVIASMSASGITPQQLAKIYKPIAQFTDVLHFGKDRMSYGHAAVLGAGLVHDLRLGLSKDPRLAAADTAYALGVLAQTSYLSPHGSDAVATQIRRMAPTLENVLPGTNRQKAVTITDLAAWADRMGNLPFAGSAISQMVTQMIAPRSKRVLHSLQTLGVYDDKGNNRYFDQKTGHSDVMGMMQQLARAYAAAQDKGPIVRALLGNTQNAARIMQALSSPDALRAYALIREQRMGMGSDPVAWLNKVQVQLMQGLGPQTQLLTSNFASLTTMIGNSLLPDLTNVVTVLAQFTGELSTFMAQHPGTAKAAGYGLAGLAAVGGIAGVLVSGMVADNALHSLVGRFLSRRGGKTAEKIAEDVLAHGGGRVGLMRSLAGGAGDLLKSGVGLNLGGAIKGLGTPLKDLGGMLRGFGIEALTTRRGVGVLAELLGKLGLRFVPVVGEVMLLADSIHFFFTHSRDLGHMLGETTKWMMHNIPSMLAASGPAIGGAMKSLVGYLLAALNPLNWLSAIANVKAGFDSAFTEDGKRIDGRKLRGAPLGLHLLGPHSDSWRRHPSSFTAPEARITGMATGGLTRGEGLAYLHRNEIVVKHPTVMKLERMARGGAASGTTIHNHFAPVYHAAPGESDATHTRRSKKMINELANRVAAVLADQLGLDIHAGGAIPQLAGHSHFAIVGARVAS